MLPAVLIDHQKPYLAVNYAANFLFLLIIWWYRIWPRKMTAEQSLKEYYEYCAKACAPMNPPI